MTQFGADTEVMAQAAARIQTIHGAIDGRMGVLRGQVEMAAAGFVGRAGTAFQTTMADFNQRAVEFSRALDAMQGEVRRSTQGSSDTDDQGASAINTVAPPPPSPITQALG